MSPTNPFAPTLVCAAVLMALLGASPLQAQVTQTVTEGTSIDVTANASNDLRVENCSECGHDGDWTRVVHLNSSFRSNICYYCTLSSVDCDDILGASYASNGPFLPAEETVFAIKQGTTFGKIRFNTISADSMNVSYQAMSCSADPPPESDFTFTTYDWIAFFTDTSTNSPTSWDWDFGDSTGSTQQNPSHFYASAGTRTVSLAATNAGGTDPTPASKSVSVSTRPSTILGGGESVDLDSDGTHDLAMVSAVGCSGDLIFDVINGATWASASEDYRTVTAADIPGSITGTSNFCTSDGLAGLFDTRFVQTSGPSVVKFWSPVVDGSQARIEFAVLTTSLPPPPNSDFTFTKYDLIAFFTDTSTGGPGAWDWDFGDSTGSTQQNPAHYYQSAGTRNVELTASNTGGSDPTPAVKSVSVSQRPSLVMGAGGSVDIDLDGSDDLGAVSMVGCGGDLVLQVLNGSTWAGASEDYRTVGLSDIPASISGTSTFCTEDEVEGLFDTRFLQNAVGDVMKFWTPVVSSTQVRLEAAILVESCGAPFNVELAGINVSGIEHHQACNQITASTVTVMNGGELTLQAGNKVVLESGFEVESGGTLTVLIQDP